jgi:hypothetical protein
VVGCADYYATFDFSWHVATTVTTSDAIAALELAITEPPRLLGPKPLTWTQQRAQRRLRPVNYEHLY